MDGHCRLVVLSRRQEEGAVHQRIPIEDDHCARADYAGRPIHFIGRQSGQYEATGLVVAVIAVVLHLNMIWVDLMAGQSVERRIVGPTREYRAGRVALPFVPKEYFAQIRWIAFACGWDRRWVAVRRTARAGRRHRKRTHSDRFPRLNHMYCIRRNAITSAVMVRSNGHYIRSHRLIIGVCVDRRTAYINRRFVIIFLLSVSLLFLVVISHRNGRWNPIQVFLKVTLTAFTATCLSPSTIQVNKLHIKKIIQ